MLTISVVGVDEELAVVLVIILVLPSFSSLSMIKLAADGSDSSIRVNPSKTNVPLNII